METYTFLRHFADSWVLLALTLFFLGVVPLGVPARQPARCTRKPPVRSSATTTVLPDRHSPAKKEALRPCAPSQSRKHRGEVETTGHDWDGIEELNNPLPRWWVWTFYATIVWGIGYTILSTRPGR